MDTPVVLGTQTFNTLLRAFGRESLTSDLLCSLSDEDLSRVDLLGKKGIEKIRTHFPFNEELRALRLRWRPKVNMLPAEVIAVGDISYESIRDVAWAVRRYADALREAEFTDAARNHFVNEFHTALMRHWLPPANEGG